jgi:hypothetical protein
MIGGYAPTRPIGQDLGQGGNIFRADKAALVVSTFRPGVREQQKGPLNTSRRQTVQQQSRIVCDNTDIIQALFVDHGQQSGNAIDKGLATYKTNVGMRPRHGRQMLAGAKADFQPDRADVRFEKATWIQCTVLVVGGDQLQLRQQPL